MYSCISVAACSGSSSPAIPGGEYVHVYMHLCIYGNIHMCVYVDIQIHMHLCMSQSLSRHSWLQDTLKRKLVDFAWHRRVFDLPGACSPFFG